MKVVKLRKAVRPCSGKVGYMSSIGNSAELECQAYARYNIDGALFCAAHAGKHLLEQLSEKEPCPHPADG